MPPKRDDIQKHEMIPNKKVRDLLVLVKPSWMHESTEMFQLLSQAEEDEQQHCLWGGVSLSHKLLRGPQGFIF